MSQTDVSPTNARLPAPRANPYVGLVPFGEHDVDWFFGREREQRIIGANLRSSRLTLLYGASGVGKSSVLLAGVLPGLRRIVARDRAARELDDPDDRDPVRFAVAVFSAWRDAPLHGLTTAVAESVRDATGEDVAPWSPNTSLRETFAGWLGPVNNLLIVLDQFEEYFLYHPHEDGPGTFAGEFVDVVTAPDLRVNFLVSLREDGLAKLDRFKGRIPRLFENYLRVRHLDAESARRAIVGPLDEYNRGRPAGSPEAVIDDDLIDEVLAEVRTHDAALEGPEGPVSEAAATTPVPDRVETPLLQLVMQRLWSAAADEPGDELHLRVSTLRERLGGTEKIVYRHLEDALNALSDDQRDLAVEVLRPLVSPTGTKIAWRASDVAFWAKHSPVEIEPILRELSSGERRILRAAMPPPNQGDGSPRYEIFHDVLAEPILEWCGEREADLARRELARKLKEEELARLAEARQRRRDRRNRVVRTVAVGLGVLTAGLVVAVVVALRNSAVADSRGLAANAVAELPVDPERSVALAVQAMGRRHTADAEAALRRALAASRVRAVLATGAPGPCRVCDGLVSPGRRGDAAVTAQLAISPDGRTVAGINNQHLQLWHPLTGERPRPAVDVGHAAGVAFTAGGDRLLVVGVERAALLRPDGSLVRTLRGSWGAGATSADGSFVTTVGRGASVWDARTGRRLAQRRGETYRSAAFGRHGNVTLQDLTHGRLVRWMWRGDWWRTIAGGTSGPSISTGFSDGGAVAADPAGHGDVRLVAADGERLRLPARSGDKPLTSVAVSPDGSRVAAVRGATVRLWGSQRPWKGPAHVVGELPHPDGVNAVVFSPDSRVVATASTDGTARLWESSTGAPLVELHGHASGVQSLAFSSDGRYVATSGEDLTIRLWDLGDELPVPGTHEVDAVAMGSNDSHVAFAEDDGDLRYWRPGLPSAKVIRPVLPSLADNPPGSGGVGRVLPTRPGGTMTTESLLTRPGAPSPTAPPVRRRDAPATLSPLPHTDATTPFAKRLRHTFVVQSRGLHPTSLAGDARPGGSLLVGYSDASGNRGRTLLLDPSTAKVRSAISDGRPVSKVALDAAAGLAAIVNSGGPESVPQVDVWEIADDGDARRDWTMKGLDRELPTDVALGPGGRLLVTTIFGGAAIYDIDTHRRLRVLANGTSREPGTEAFYRGVFSPNGKTVAVAGSRDAHLYDVQTGRERPFHLTGHTSVLRSIAYSADGTRLLTASADATVRVWEAATGKPLAVLARHAGRVDAAAFTSDGQIVSGGVDGGLRVYPCPTCGSAASLLALARRQITR